MLENTRTNLLILGTLFSLTAFDTLLLGFAIPKLIASYDLTRSQAGFLGTSLMIGVGIGALVLGAASDLVGRKRVIFLSVIMFAASTGLMSFVESYLAFAILLFTSGFGLGGGLTMSITYLPDVIDGPLDRYMCYLESFWGVGALLIVTSSYLLTKRPLSELFLVGAIPIFFLPLFHMLPDVRPERESMRGNVRNLIRDYGRVTLLLWVIWFCGVYTYYGVFLWLPDVMLLQQGQRTSVLIPIYGIQIFSPLVLSFIAREGNTEKLLVTYSFLAAVSTLFFVYAGSYTLMALSILVTSFFSIGSWVLLILATQKSYPQKIRGLGVGSAASVGRIGGILAPYLTGYFMDIYGTFEVPFGIFVALFLVMGVFALPVPAARRVNVMKEL
jgi:putative MFS transporter